MEGDVITMMEAVTNALGVVIGWIGTVLTSLTSTTGELAPLMPLVAVGISISALLLAVKVFKSFSWGT